MKTEKQGNELSQHSHPKDMNLQVLTHNYTFGAYLEMLIYLVPTS